MSKRIYVIKETKSPSFTIANFDASRNAIQASKLGLLPAKPDFAELDAALQVKGASVAYELTCDGTRLGFDVRFGKQRKTLASARLSDFKTLADRRRVMNQLLAYGLVDARDVPASADEVTAKENERATLQRAADRIDGRLARMAYEKSVDDTPADDVVTFKAWVRKQGAARLVDLFEAIQANTAADKVKQEFLATGAPRFVKIDEKARKAFEAKPDLRALRQTVVGALDKLLVKYQEAVRKQSGSERSRLAAKVKSLDGELKKMVAP